jgi:predicted deacylase
MTKDVLPNADMVIDFHTGGSSRYNYPQIRYTKSSLDSYTLATQFAPRFILEKPTIRGSLRWVARKSGIPMIVYEGGEALRLDGFAIEKGLQGLQRVLASLHMKEMSLNPRYVDPTLLVKRSAWLRASRAGIFISTKTAGACVIKGEPIGMITSPYGSKSSHVLSGREGYILAHNNMPIVSQGDALFNIAFEYTTLTKPLA